MSTRACPGSPLCLTNMSIFAEDPRSVEFHLNPSIKSRGVFSYQHILIGTFDEVNGAPGDTKCTIAETLLRTYCFTLYNGICIIPVV